MSSFSAAGKRALRHVAEPLLCNRAKCLPLMRPCTPKSHRANTIMLGAAQGQASVLACNIYVSEGHDMEALQAMQDSLQGTPGVHLAHVFVDAPYHRTGFTITSLNTEQLVAGALALARSALDLIDLRRHSATHPRLGALDHISVHHLSLTNRPPSTPALAQAAEGPGSCSGQPQLHPNEASLRAPGPGLMQHAAAGNVQAGVALASTAARAMGSALAAPPSQLPVFYYGSAHPHGRRLADIRRGLGYFKGSSTPAPPAVACGSKQGGNASSGPEWRGGLPVADLSHFPPDEGPTDLTPQHGLVTIGAVPWVVNYNIPVSLPLAAGGEAVQGAGSSSGGGGGGAEGSGAAASAELFQLAKRLARGVSERGGGLRLVESMALAHADGVVEVACNLLGGGEGVPPSDVQAFVETLAAGMDEKLVVGQGYQTGKTPQQLVQVTLDALSRC